MRICITAQSNNLESLVDPRFGRCQYFIIVDPDTLEFEAVQNPSISVGGGAGIQSGQFMVNKGVEVVLTGNVGPNAYATLQAAGIEIITQVSGKVSEAIEKYKKGELSSAVSGPNVAAHFGMGMGGGRGMGRGRGTISQPQTPPVSKNEELKMLKEQAKAMQEEIKKITQRIEELDKDKKVEE